MHIPNELKDLLIKYEPEIKNFSHDFTILNRYYVETRYPGDYPEFSWNDAEEALAAAEKIKNFVLEREKSD
ncbi:HEPN domain-containing protein [Candidatus Gottesmanbacteria bacterium]|nr:HEPN domain-containing protein [Candidatus Gottesmanbacteria bacterium]